jgi:CubicO group peptidase (beta-lactamase class C family)
MLSFSKPASWVLSFFLVCLLPAYILAQGTLDSMQLNNVREQIKNGDFGQVDAILVSVSDTLVFEQYFHKYNPSKLHTLQSATKSINALLIGILLDKGYLPSVEEPISRFFSDYDFSDSLKAGIRVKDLLTMSSGIDWQEEGVVDRKANDQLAMNDSKNYIGYFLSQPMQEPPGSRFYYNSGGSIALGGIVQRASGQTVEAFVNQYLFKPLGITRYKWQSTKKGQYHTGGGLFLSARDLLKIGQMVLNGGVWQGERIVSQQWIDESLRAHFTTNRANGWGTRFEYGYQWWRLTHQGKTEVIAARGWGDQRLFIIPQLEAVIVIYGSNFFNKPTLSIDHLLEQVLEAFAQY